MAKIAKNIKENTLDCTMLSRLYSTVDKEDRENSRKLRKIFAFSNKCLEEAKEIQAQIRDKQRKEDAMQGLYIEIYNFAEEEMPRIFKAMYKDEILSFGTNFGKNYHQLILKRKELMMKNGGQIKINGQVINQIPEIGIIEVGV